MVHRLPEFRRAHGNTDRRDSLLPLLGQPVSFENIRCKVKCRRDIATAPYRILDAPGIIDDYYLNVLDWTKERVSIALRDTVYCYNTETREVAEIYTAPTGYISSVCGDNDVLAIGDSTGKLILQDCETQRTIYSAETHKNRICAMSFCDRAFSAGDKDGLIVNYDPRTFGPIGTFTGHRNEICNLKWNTTSRLLASGGNDNKIKIWRMGYPMHETLNGHGAGVKAMDWCPWKYNILCSGGGVKDKTIRLWDVSTCKEIKRIETDSQICTLHYLARNREIITSHGFISNDLRLWECSTDMRLTKSFGSHESRILHTTLSPNEQTLLSLGPDESLKFWKISDDREIEKKRDSIQIR
jgi:cell division cycle 20, cofactor of APC complex